MRYAEALLILVGGICAAVASIAVAPTVILIKSAQEACKAARGKR